MGSPQEREAILWGKKSWSKAPQKMVKSWSKVGQAEAIMMVKSWSKAGQKFLSADFAEGLD
jgi:hypothetical protein